MYGLSRLLKKHYSGSTEEQIKFLKQVSADNYFESAIFKLDLADSSFNDDEVDELSNYMLSVPFFHQRDLLNNLNARRILLEMEKRLNNLSIDEQEKTLEKTLQWLNTVIEKLTPKKAKKDSVEANMLCSKPSTVENTVSTKVANKPSVSYAPVFWAMTGTAIFMGIKENPELIMNNAQKLGKVAIGIAKATYNAYKK